ncbi:MAG TPA: gephyrin-like molybdotransferase Glp [Streptosporangiaceae bacterium]
MQSVESYLSEIIAAIAPVPATDLPVAEADGAVLAADATAAWPLPGFDNSSMDGYAVLAADVASASEASPVTLGVQAESAAGDTTIRTLTPGHCIKIMTGALLPGGADAIVPVEWTDGGTQTVTISQAASKGNAIRRAGDDAQPGDLLLPAGTRLGAAQIGVLAAAGHGTLRARRRPRVTVISTGNELAPPGSPLVPGQIWDSNSYMLTAAARQAGAAATRHPTLRDDTGVVLAAISQAAASADLLITSGGVSMGGEHDVVKAALTELGTVSFRKVAMQPGMPQGFGQLGEGRTPIFTLPGNPVSAFVSFTLFVEPAIRALQGLPAQRTVPRQSRLAEPVRSPEGRRSFLRGNLDRQADVVVPLTGQSSHQIASLARADTLIIVPESVTALPAGALVEILELP